MKIEWISKSEEDTKKVAKELVKFLSKGDVVLLSGDLGAGKTALVKSVVYAFNKDENIVTSPTFTLINEYDMGEFMIYHFDLYRIKSEDELVNIGADDYLFSDGICFVEWPERASELFDIKHKKIDIEKLGETQRKFTLTY